MIAAALLCQAPSPGPCVATSSLCTQSRPLHFSTTQPCGAHVLWLVLHMNSACHTVGPELAAASRGVAPSGTDCCHCGELEAMPCPPCSP